jgi:Peptidase family M23
VRDPLPAELREALRAAADHRPDPRRAPVVLALPFTGWWQVVRTPARRVPSHGTHFGGQTYALDFVPVDERGRPDSRRDWRSFLGTEPVERFVGFGRAVRAPAGGVVVAAHSGEPDLVARRSPVAALPYLLAQGRRLATGLAAILGNHVILQLDAGDFVLLAHLRAGSLRVRPGDRVRTGDPVGGCGNSGNSTQPHLHFQAMDSADLLAARGLPVAFRDYAVRAVRAGGVTEVGVPEQREIVGPASAGPA